MTGVVGGTTAAFIYDGDGNRVKSTVSITKTVYIGNYFEWTGSTGTMKKYYYAGATRVAMRTGTGTGVTGLKWLLEDHLGSTNVIVNGDGSSYNRLTYKPWGETRAGVSSTTFKYTGQRQNSYINLYWYGSRWYDDLLGRFIQPDPIVPVTGEGGNPDAVGYLGASTYSPLIVDYQENQFLEQLNQESNKRLQDPNFKLPPVATNSIAFDRYAYSLNNPVRYVDPTGHDPIVVILAFLNPELALPIAIIAVGLYFVVPGVREGVTAGLKQAGEDVSNGVQTLFSRPRNNQAQEKQFIGAVKQLEKELGRKLDQDETRQLHEALHHLEDPGFWDIVDQGHKEFDKEKDDGGGGN